MGAGLYRRKLVICNLYQAFARIPVSPVYQRDGVTRLSMFFERVSLFAQQREKFLRDR